MLITVYSLTARTKLLPTGIGPSTEVDAGYDTVSLGKLLAQMQAVDNGMNVVVLDAWRNNPFARLFRSFNPGHR